MFWTHINVSLPAFIIAGWHIEKTAAQIRWRGAEEKREKEYTFLYKRYREWGYSSSKLAVEVVTELNRRLCKKERAAIGGQTLIMLCYTLILEGLLVNYKSHTGVALNEPTWCLKGAS